MLNIKFILSSIFCLFVLLQADAQDLPSANVWGNTKIKLVTQNGDSSGFAPISNIVTWDNTTSKPSFAYSLNQILYGTGSGQASSSNLTTDGTNLFLNGGVLRGLGTPSLSTDAVPVSYFTWSNLAGRPSATNQIIYGDGLQSANLSFTGSNTLILGSSSVTSSKFLMDRTNAGTNSSYSILLSSPNSPTINIGYGADFTGERSGTVDITNAMYQWFVPSANQMQFGRLNKTAGTSFTSADEVPYLTLGNSAHTLHQATYISQSAVDGILKLNKLSGTNWNYIEYLQAGTRAVYAGINNNSDYIIGVDGVNKGIVLLPNGTGTVDVSSKRVTNVANGVGNSDAVNLGQLSSYFKKGSNIALTNEVNTDNTFIGAGDRDYLKNVAYWGDVNVTITGAGTFTNSRANLNGMFDFSGGYFAITGTDATTTKIVIDIDCKQNQPNFSRGVFAPYFLYRYTSSSFTYYRKITVEISTDNTTWYNPYTITDVSTTGIGGFISGETAMVHPSATFRYVRYTLENRAEGSSTPTKDQVWISSIGIRHIGNPFYNGLLSNAGGGIWGDISIYPQGNISTPNITLSTSGTGSFAGTVSGSNGTASNHFVTLAQLQNAANITSGTLPDGRLSNNVPLKNTANIFTSYQNIIGDVSPSGSGGVSLGGYATGGYNWIQSFSNLPLYINSLGNHTVINPNGNSLLIGQTISNGIDKVQITGSTTQTGQWKSTVATGTAPLSIVSTTRVNNLNTQFISGLDTTILAQRNQVNTFTQRNNFTNFVSITGASAIAAADHTNYTDAADRIYTMQGDGNVRSSTYQALINANQANDTFAMTTAAQTFTLSSNLVNTVDVGLHASTFDSLDIRLPATMFDDNQTISITTSNKRMIIGQGDKIKITSSTGVTLLQIVNDTNSTLSEKYEINSAVLGYVSMQIQYSKKRNLWRITSFNNWVDQ